MNKYVVLFIAAITIGNASLFAQDEPNTITTAVPFLAIVQTLELQVWENKVLLPVQMLMRYNGTLRSSLLWITSIMWESTILPI